MHFHLRIYFSRGDVAGHSSQQMPSAVLLVF